MSDILNTISQKCNPIFDNLDFVEKAYVFGSYAKGTNDDSSDIDIVVELNKTMDHNFFQLYPDLEKVTSKKIDIYSIDELDHRFLNSIRKDFKIIYERKNTNNV